MDRKLARRNIRSALIIAAIAVFMFAISFVAAGLVIAAASFRGGRMVREDLPPLAEARAEDAPSAEQKLRIVLDGMSDQTLVGELCDRHQVTESEFYAWRATTLDGATAALARAENT